MSSSVVVFAGKKGAGKSYHARVICGRIAASSKVSFADLLRDECSEYVHMDVFGDLHKDMKICFGLYTEAGQDIISSNCHIKTNRDFMIYIARMMRSKNPDHYAEEMFKRIMDEPSTVFVIDDMRFTCELDYLLKTGKNIRVVFVGSLETDPDAGLSEDITTLHDYVLSKQSERIAIAYMMSSTQN